MQATSLKARYVVPLDRPPIAGGVVTIAGERVVEVAARPPGGATLVDLGDVVLVPGLVNAHTHLEFSDLNRPLGTQGMSLVAWIRAVIARRSQQKTDLRASVAAGIRESLQHGVTAVCDVTTADLGVYPDLPQGPDVVGLLEALGFSRSRAASALVAVEDRLQQSRRKMGFQPVRRWEASRLDPTEGNTPDVESTRSDAAADRRMLGLSPHAPYTVGPRLLEDLIRLAARDRLPVAMHLAESLDELELLDSGGGPFRELLEERGMWDAEALPRRSRPLAYLRVLSEAPRALVIHGTHLDEREFEFLAAHRERMALVYCPRTHAYFNEAPYPLAAALQKGARVALGTDSRASSPDLSLLAEIRHAARAHPRTSPSQLLQMATLDAAEALGIARDVGSITAGKLANLTAMPVEAVRCDAPADAIVLGDQQPAATWYRGMKVFGH